MGRSIEHNQNLEKRPKPRRSRSEALLRWDSFPLLPLLERWVTTHDLCIRSHTLTRHGRGVSK